MLGKTQHVVILLLASNPLLYDDTCCKRVQLKTKQTYAFLTTFKMPFFLSLVRFKSMQSTSGSAVEERRPPSSLPPSSLPPSLCVVVVVP